MDSDHGSPIHHWSILRLQQTTGNSWCRSYPLTPPNLFDLAPMQPSMGVFVVLLSCGQRAYSFLVSAPDLSAYMMFTSGPPVAISGKVGFAPLSRAFTRSTSLSLRVAWSTKSRHKKGQHRKVWNPFARRDVYAGLKLCYTIQLSSKDSTPFLMNVQIISYSPHHVNNLFPFLSKYSHV